MVSPVAAGGAAFDGCSARGDFAATDGLVTADPEVVFECAVELLLDGTDSFSVRGGGAS